MTIQKNLTGNGETVTTGDTVVNEEVTDEVTVDDAATSNESGEEVLSEINDLLARTKELIQQAEQTESTDSDNSDDWVQELQQSMEQSTQAAQTESDSAQTSLVDNDGNLHQIPDSTQTSLVDSDGNPLQIDEQIIAKYAQTPLVDNDGNLHLHQIPDSTQTSVVDNDDTPVQTLVQHNRQQMNDAFVQEAQTEVSFVCGGRYQQQVQQGLLQAANQSSQSTLNLLDNGSSNSTSTTETPAVTVEVDNSATESVEVDLTPATAEETEQSGTSGLNFNISAPSGVSLGNVSLPIYNYAGEIQSISVSSSVLSQIQSLQMANVQMQNIQFTDLVPEASTTNEEVATPTGVYLGAMQNRRADLISGTSIEDYMDVETALVDVDVADRIVSLQNQNQSNQSGQQMLASSESIDPNLYSLLS